MLNLLAGYYSHYNPINISVFCIEIKKKRVPPKRRISISVFCIGNKDENGSSETSDYYLGLLYGK